MSDICSLVIPFCLSIGLNYIKEITILFSFIVFENIYIRLEIILILTSYLPDYGSLSLKTDCPSIGLKYIYKKNNEDCFFYIF